MNTFQEIMETLGVEKTQSEEPELEDVDLSAWIPDISEATKTVRLRRVICVICGRPGCGEGGAGWVHE